MTGASYRDVLAELRREFPTPAPAADDDARLVGRIAEGLARALELRGGGSKLRGAPPLDASAILATRLEPEGRSADEVTSELVAILHGLPLETHPRGQVNVNVQPSTLSLLGALLPAVYNPNMSSDGRGAGCSATERRIASLAARLVGFDPELAGGIFTFGGTGTLLYGVKLGIEKAIPDAMRKGVRGDVAILASQRCHHTCLTAAGWLGLGSEQVVRTPVGPDNAFDPAALREAARDVVRSGGRIAAIVATVGTTDAFGLDDVAAAVRARDELVAEFHLDYSPHVHADAVIGWAWTVFHDYDLESNPLGFSADALQAIEVARPRIDALRQADSLGIDFHKTGFVPYVSSMVLARLGQDFERLARHRSLMPYLFHSGSYHPGLFTLETTRAAGGVLAAWANLRWLGVSGLQTLLGHALEMTAELRRALRALPSVAIVNEANVGPVTLYRAYPPGVRGAEMWRRETTDASAESAAQEHNEFNRRLHTAALARLSASSGAAIGLTSSAGQTPLGTPLVALKSYLLSPWLESSDIQAIVEQVNGRT